MANKNDVIVVRQTSPLPTDRTEKERECIAPVTDVYESADAYVMMLDMPGASKDTISVTLDGTALIVKGDVKSMHREDVNLLVNELRSQGYYRAYRLGEGINQNGIDARFENGILTVNLFKTEGWQQKQININ